MGHFARECKYKNGKIYLSQTWGPGTGAGLVPDPDLIPETTRKRNIKNTTAGSTAAVTGAEVTGRKNRRSTDPSLGTRRRRNTKGDTDPHQSIEHDGIDGYTNLVNILSQMKEFIEFGREYIESEAEIRSRP